MMAVLMLNFVCVQTASWSYRQIYTISNIGRPKLSSEPWSAQNVVYLQRKWHRQQEQQVQPAMDQVGALGQPLGLRLPAQQRRIPWIHSWQARSKQQWQRFRRLGLRRQWRKACHPRVLDCPCHARHAGSRWSWKNQPKLPSLHLRMQVKVRWGIVQASKQATERNNVLTAATRHTLLHPTAAGKPPRVAYVQFVEVYAPSRDAASASRNGCAFHGTVLLSGSGGARVASLERVPRGQPPMTAGEYELSEELVKRDPQFQAALARRGVTNMELVMVDPWCVG